MSAKRKEPRKAFRAFFLQELLAMICVTRIISASSRNNKIVLWVVSEAKLVFLYYIKAIPHLDRCGLDTRVVGLAPPVVSWRGLRTFIHVTVTGNLIIYI